MPHTRRPSDEWRSDIREANRAARSAGWRIALWIIAAVALVTAIMAALWAAGVLFSGPKGAGDQTRITNDGRNRVNAQEWFESQYQQIKSTDRRIDEAGAELDRKPDDEFARTNYTGLVNRCMEMVGNYNAEAGKVSRAQWKSPTLPQQIDESDASTDCKRSPK